MTTLDFDNTVKGLSDYAEVHGIDGEQWRHVNNARILILLARTQLVFALSRFDRGDREGGAAALREMDLRLIKAGSKALLLRDKLWRYNCRRMVWELRVKGGAFAAGEGVAIYVPESVDN